MIFTEESLKNIIIEHINCKRIVYLAAKLRTGLCKWDEDTDEVEEELTKYLISHAYETPIPNLHYITAPVHHDYIDEEIADLLMFQLTEMDCSACRYSEENNPTFEKFDKRFIKCKRCVEDRCMWSLSKEEALKLAKEIRQKLC